MISKANFLAVFQHNWVGFNTHKEFLKKSVDAVACDNLTEHDIQKLQISLNNMRQHLENVSEYLTENSQVPGEVGHGK